VPFIFALAVALIVMLAAIALMPVALVQRYRAGTARRLARGWVANINLLTIAISTAIFLVGAAVTSVWVPEAFTYSLMGLAGGCLLGLLGLAWSRWEATAGSLHYTPNRLLVLAITLVVTSRLLYGFWRAWQTWRSSPEDISWVVSAGVAGSLAAGAVVLGYYLTYWTGVRRRLTQHRRKQAAMEAGNRARRVPGRRV
jgi:hypothetical protein